MRTNAYGAWKRRKKAAGAWDVDPVAREAGRLAYVQDRTLAANPYGRSEPVARREWQRGWRKARHAHLTTPRLYSRLLKASLERSPL